jgi:DnaA family protein
MKQLLLDITETGHPSLENFVPEKNNAELLHALKELAAGQQQDRFYYIWGEAGSGKSHLLQAVTNAFSQQQCIATYIDCNQTNPFSLGTDIDCISIDNVEQLNDSAQIQLFNLYNRMREKGQGIFLASGLAPPAQLSLRQDLATRLGWGLVYQVYSLTDEKKIEVMKNHAMQRGFELPWEICSYLLKHERRDLPSLIRLVDALDQFSLIKQRPVTLPLLRELLQSTLPSGSSADH